MRFFSKRDTSTRVVIFDIGSASAAASIVDLNPQKKPTILYTLRLPIVFQEELDFERFMRSMFSTFLELSMRINNEGREVANKTHGKKKIEKAYCILSSSWYSGKTTVLKHTGKKPFSVTQKFLDKLVSEGTKEFREATNSLQTENGARLLDQHIVQVHLNEYPTNSPVGKKAHSIDISLFVSFINNEIVEKLEEMVFKVFRIEQVTFKSYSLVSFAVIRDLFPHEDRFIVLDIGGEITDVSVTYDGALMNIASFPHGHNTYVRRVQKAFATTPKEAASRIKMYFEDKGGTVSQDSVKLQKALSEAQNDWNSSFKKILASISENSPLPTKLFLTANASYAHWFASSIESSDYSDIVFVERPFRITVLDEGQLRGCCNYARKDSKLDPFLALETVFFNSKVSE